MRITRGDFAWPTVARPMESHALRPGTGAGGNSSRLPAHRGTPHLGVPLAEERGVGTRPTAYLLHWLRTAVAGGWHASRAPSGWNPSSPPLLRSASAIAALHCNNCTPGGAAPMCTPDDRPRAEALARVASAAKGLQQWAHSMATQGFSAAVRETCVFREAGRHGMAAFHRLREIGPAMGPLLAAYRIPYGRYPGMSRAWPATPGTASSPSPEPRAQAVSARGPATGTTGGAQSPSPTVRRRPAAALAAALRAWGAPALDLMELTGRAAWGPWATAAPAILHKGKIS